MKILSKHGFTIVELVIVIAVIAILAAVLIPTFNSVINKANEASALQEAKSALGVVSAEIASQPSKELFFVVKDKKSGDTEYVFTYNPSGNRESQSFYNTDVEAAALDFKEMTLKYDHDFDGKEDTISLEEIKLSDAAKKDIGDRISVFAVVN